MHVHMHSDIIAISGGDGWMYSERQTVNMLCWETGGLVASGPPPGRASWIRRARKQLTCYADSIDGAGGSRGHRAPPAASRKTVNISCWSPGSSRALANPYPAPVLRRGGGPDALLDEGDPRGPGGRPAG